MDPNLPAVLLMGGGEGMGPVKKTAMELVQSLFDKHLNKPIGQLIVICGRNRSLASTLESMDWKIPVKVISYLSLILENYLFKKLFSNCILIIGKRIWETNGEMDGSLWLYYYKGKFKLPNSKVLQI